MLKKERHERSGIILLVCNNNKKSWILLWHFIVDVKCKTIRQTGCWINEQAFVVFVFVFLSCYLYTSKDLCFTITFVHCMAFLIWCSVGLGATVMIYLYGLIRSRRRRRRRKNEILKRNEILLGSSLNHKMMNRFFKQQKKN